MWVNWWNVSTLERRLVCFWDKYVEEVEEGFKFSHDNVGDPNNEYYMEEE